MGNSTTQANHDKVIISRKGIGFIIEKLICAEPDTQAEPAFCGRLTLFVRPLMSKITIAKCRIPDDRIDSRRYPLFMARAVLKELIESLQSTQGVKPC